MVRHKKDILIISFLLLSAFAIRFLLLSTEEMISTDAVQYLTFGKNIMLGKGFLSDGSHFPDIIRPPLYPVLIAISHLFIQDLELAGRAVSILFGSLLVIPLFLLTREFFGRKPAILSAILILMHPVLTETSISACTDATFIFILMVTLFLGWLAIDRKKGIYYFFVGISFAISYLTRQVGILFFLMYLFVILLFLRSDSMSLRYILRGFTSLLIGFLILFIPYMLWVQSCSGRWMEPAFAFMGARAQWEAEVALKLRRNQLPGRNIPEGVRKYEGSLYGLNADGNEIMLWKRIQQPETGAVIPISVLSSLKKIARNLYTLINLGLPAIFPLAFFFCIGYGIVGQVWSKHILKKHLYLAAMFVVSIIFVLLSGLELRWLGPSVCIGAIWAGNGIVMIGNFFETSLRKAFNRRPPFFMSKSAFVLVFTLVSTGSFFPGIYKTHLKHKDKPLEHKRAGLWIRENRPDSVIMSRKPQIAFYAEGKYVVLPFASYPDIMKFAKKRGVKIIVVDERYILSTRPQMTHLLTETEVPAGLELIYKSDKANGQKLLLYEIEHY